jgi:hypothetical protein
MLDNVLNNAFRVARKELTKEELSIINAFKSMGFSIEFIYFLYRYFFYNKNFKFSNLEEFSKIHPEVKKDSVQKTYNILKNNNNERDFNFFEHRTYETEFIRYSKGVKFFSKIIMDILNTHLLGLGAVVTLKTLFYNAVVGSEGIFTKNFHSSVQEKTIYEVKEPKEFKEETARGYLLQVTYFNIKITTKVDKGFFVDSSKCKVEYLSLIHISEPTRPY